MAMTQAVNVKPVVLVGGSGSRLWPLSVEQYPKQFLSFDGGETLFQQVLRRMSAQSCSAAVGAVFSYSSPLIVSSTAYQSLIHQQATVELGSILLEPARRNTAPAILAAAITAQAQDPDACILVAPSDHVIRDMEAFNDAVARGVPAALNGNIVIFGIQPTYAETGFGYIQAAPAQHDNAIDVLKFVEKPALAKAERMLSMGGHYWNAGLFLCRASVMIDAFQALKPEILAGVRRAIDQGQSLSKASLMLDLEAWSELEDISIDYAIIQAAQNVKMIPFYEGWSDLGSWPAVHEELPKTAQGNTQQGDAYMIGCQDSLVMNRVEDKPVVAIGLDGIVIVQTPTAVLVVDKDKAQEVKGAVDLLKEEGRS